MITIREIEKIVCDYFNIRVFRIKLKTRKREIVKCRQISYYFSRKYTKESFNQIAFIIAGQDHATALSSKKRVENDCLTDKKLRKHLKLIDYLIRKRIRDLKNGFIKRKYTFKIVNMRLMKFKRIIEKRLLKNEILRQYEQQIAFEQLSKMIDEEIKQII